jgi:hypothetical protein
MLLSSRAAPWRAPWHPHCSATPLVRVPGLSKIGTAFWPSRTSTRDVRSVLVISVSHLVSEKTHFLAFTHFLPVFPRGYCPALHGVDPRNFAAPHPLVVTQINIVMRWNARSKSYCGERTRKIGRRPKSAERPCDGRQRHRRMTGQYAYSEDHHLEVAVQLPGTPAK